MKSTGVKIIIPSERRWLEFMDTSIDSILRTIGFENLAELNFAIREALINAMRVSESLNKDNVVSIEIQVTVSEGCLEIQIFDEGKGLPSGWQERINTKTCEEFVRGTSGRGLFFIKAYMDEMHSKIASDGRHVFIMRKNF